VCLCQAASRASEFSAAEKTQTKDAAAKLRKRFPHLEADGLLTPEFLKAF
jgi:hypothetical protein